jgi:hypothetical protein
MDRERRKIASYHHSFVKIVGVRTLGAFVYASKYCFNDVFKEGLNETLVRCWIHGKRQYSISKDLLDSLVSLTGRVLLDSCMYNSNRNRLSMSSPYYVGVLNGLQTDALKFKMRPPPMENDDLERIEEIFSSHNDWIEAFDISDAYCCVCNIPLFFDDDDTFKFKDGGKVFVACPDCYNEKMDDEIKLSDDVVIKRLVEHLSYCCWMVESRSCMIEDNLGICEKDER